MAESFPSAVQLFAKAMNVSEKELFKMMEQGQVISAEVLPKVAKEMRKAAMAGGALEQKLTSTRVAQGQFTTAMQLAQDKVFKSGFDKGLAGLFQTMTTSMNENGETLVRIGKIYEKVFNGLSIVVKGATAFIESFVRVLETLWMSIKWGIENPMMGLLAALPLITVAVANLGKVMAMAFRAPMVILTTIVALFDEIRAFFDENVDGLFDDKNATDSEAAATAAQRRLMFGIGKKGDAQLAAGGSLVDPTGLTKYGSDIGLNAADASGWLTRNKGGEANIMDKALSFLYGIGKTNYDMGANDPTNFRYVSTQQAKQAANVTFNITSTDPKQAADETWSIFSNFFGDAAEARR